MDREALVAYLENIRNLETMKYHLGEIIHQLGNAILQQNMLLDKKEERKVSGKTIASVIALITLVGVGALIFLLTEYNWGLFQFLLHYFVPLFFLVVAFVVFAGAIPDISLTKKLNREARAYNLEVDKRTGAVNEELRKLENTNKYYNEEMKKVQLLLTEAYAFNLIPMPYRDIVNIIYIHDYMSTSEATLQETLLHTHMEEGIRKIAARLDTIISQNMQMISLMKMQLIQNAAVSRQLSAIEADTKMAAHFSRVNSYILTANYLK